MMGILCGATTNTPALGAAQQALQQLGLPSEGAALGCAVTYPSGCCGRHPGDDAPAQALCETGRSGDSQ